MHNACFTVVQINFDSLGRPCLLGFLPEAGNSPFAVSTCLVENASRLRRHANDVIFQQRFLPLTITLVVLSDGASTANILPCVFLH